MKKLLTLLVLCVLCIGSAWGASGETHGVTIVAFSQLLNGGVSISDVKITNPGYAISKVVLNCNYNKTAGGVTISVTVGGKSFGSSVTFNEKATKDISFTDAPASGNIVISFKNNCTASTGCGTFYLNSVTLTEGDASPKINVGENATITPPASAQDVKFYYTIENAQDDAQVTATEECDWINPNDATFTYGSDDKGKFVQFSVAANTSVNSRSATITLLYEEGTTSTQEVVTIKQAGVEPVITLDADAFTPTANGGECGTGVSVAPTVDGYELVANANVDWIKNIAITDDQITFAVDPNSGEARQGTITLTYQPSNSEEGVNPLTFTKVITVDQASAGYTVTIETPENGTLEVKNGENVVSSGDLIAAGTTLTITATPNEGYKFRNWQYKKGEGNWTTKTANFEYTVDEYVSFRANFDALAEYAVKFYSVGTPINETAYPVFEGQTVKSVEPTFDVPAGWTLSGWTTEGTFDNGSAAPAMYDITVTLPALEEGASNEINLYAVYTQDITGVGESAWTLVTDANTLKAGDKLVIASNSMGATAGDIESGNNYLSKAETADNPTTFSSDKTKILSLANGTVVFALGGTSGAWTLAKDNNFLTRNSGNLKWQSTVNENSKWSISIDENENVKILEPNNTNNRILYNVNNSRFKTYTSNTTTSMLLPQIYRYEVGSMPIYAVAELPTAFNMTTQDVYTTLAEAVDAVDGTATIKMIANEAVDVATNGITIPEGKNITLDLNGMEVAGVCSTESTSALITNNGTLTIKGTGKLTYGATPTWIYEGGDDYSGSYASNLITNNGTLTVESGCLENAAEGSACYAIDNYNAGTVEINGGTIKAAKSTIRMFYGTGSLTINAGTVESGRYNIVSNSGKTSENTITIKGGTFNTTDTSFDDSGYNINGWMDGESTGSTITISGGTFNQYVYSGYTTTITGGYFASALEFENCEHFISGGFFAERPVAEYVAEGKVAIPNEDETYLWKVVAGEGNANLIQTWENGTTYAYVQSGDEVTLKETDETLGKLTNIEIKENIENVTINYERTFNNTEWQSLYVPFEIKLTSDLLEKYEFAYINDNHLINSLPQIEYIEMEQGQVLIANHPYLIKAKEIGEQTIEFGIVDLCETESKTIDCSSTSAMFNFVGVYDQTAQSAIAEQDEAQPYVMSGGKFIKLATGKNVAPYRFYMTIVVRPGCEQFITLADEVKLVNAFGDDFDDADAISEIKSESVREGAYDLMGRKVTSLVKGNVYIINGKKTYIR